MHMDEFRKFQRERATSNLVSVVMACRRRFLNAARLLEVRGASMDTLSSFGANAAIVIGRYLGPSRFWPNGT
jgi:hypothetical protein